MNIEPIEPDPAVAGEDLRIPARDGLALAATRYGPPAARSLVIVNSATAVPRGFYRHFAQAAAATGHTVVTYDYRGIGGSRSGPLSGCTARMRDWALLDMQGVLDWARAQVSGPGRISMVGHSFGGQAVGLLEDPSRLAKLLTFSSQSGYWRLQGGEQKWVVGAHVHLTLPLLSKALGYMPMAKLGAGEDMPAGVALEWARWCRNPRYLLGDPTLPLERFARFPAPVLAYSIADDKWGTAAAVDAMMSAYPVVERRHIEVGDGPLPVLGHFGLFRPQAAPLWRAPLAWLGRPE